MLHFKSFQPTDLFQPFQIYCVMIGLLDIVSDAIRGEKAKIYCFIFETKYFTTLNNTISN